MTPKVLINLIVGQTTILIAQLSTAAGIRAPLGDLAGQLFLDLSRALEAEGVSRKVVADMFGLALRSYQKKVQRLEESATDRGLTLWGAVLHYVEDHAPVTRLDVEGRFARDDRLAVAAVLNDLVASGLVTRDGTRDAAVYNPKRAEERPVLSSEPEELSSIVWTLIYDQPGIARKALAERLSVTEERVSEAVEQLLKEGAVSQVDDGYKAGTVVIPVGDEPGWAAAVFDHYRAVATSIGKKLQALKSNDPSHRTVGGTTITFDVHPKHPHLAEVMQLLEHTRYETDRLWDRVRAWNDENPPPEDEMTRITFYFGQSQTSGITKDDQ